MTRRLTRALAAALLLTALTGPLWPSAAVGQESQGSCVVCHGAFGQGPLGDPVRLYPEDVHAEEGFGCVACHGGDATIEGMDAMDPAKGYIGAPTPTDVPQVCGRCHSNAQFMRQFNPSLRVDQVAEYRTSVHGQRLFELGDTSVATCVSCHPAHAIKPPSDPNSSVHPLNVPETCAACHADPEHMASYAVPTDQLEQYRQSVHWEVLSVEGDLSAPTCNDCHGNHGAAPPGVAWVGNVCGQCHSVMADLFAGSFHSQIFNLLGTPGCATCHSNHAIKRAGDELLGAEPPAACAACHTPTSSGGQVASTMRALIDSLDTRLENADSVLAAAENAGMEVSSAQFSLNEAQSSLVQARTAVHSFSVDSVSERVNAGLEVAGQAYGRGLEALDELQFRRMGLAVSVGIIMLLIVGLVFKIRQIEEKRT